MFEGSNTAGQPIRRARSHDDLIGNPAPKIRVVEKHTNDVGLDGMKDHPYLDHTAFKEPPRLYSDAFSDILVKYELDHPTPILNPLQVVASLPDSDEPNKHIFAPFAKFALNYFNCIENADFNLVEVTRVGCSFSCPRSTIHLNFKASSNSGKSELFYAELKTKSLNKIDEKDTEVLGCAMLKEVDTGNPLGLGCSICSDKVIHPGPKDGHTVIAGNKFEGARFWLYDPSMGRDVAQIRQRTARYIDMYTACTKKAITHLNLIVKADWELLDVLAASERLERCRKIIHLNFTVKSSILSVSRICFAEVFLPLFEGHSPDNWIAKKEPFIEVGGCCILEKDDSYESHSGRVCLVCNEQLIHPGPRYGYREFAGDMVAFANHDFKRVSTGVFDG